MTSSTESVERWPRLGRALPILRWLPQYERRRLRGDLVAGAIVAALLVPQSLGYARIAGVPVEVGLYAVPLALLAYAVLGSSPQLIVGPASTVAIVSGSLVADITSDNPEDTVAVTSALAIAAGLVLVGTGLLRIAWVAEFLSKPIVTGFVFGLTLTIVIGELPTLLGIPKPGGDLLGVLVRTLGDLGDVHWPTAAVGASALAFLFGGRKLAPRVPWGLVTVVAAVIASKLLDLGDEGVQLIGEVPAGLPPLELPIIPREDLGAVFVGGISLALVALAEGLAATRLFATRGGYRVETERELIGMGAANVGAGLTGGLGVAGSLSKTASAEQAGSTSQVSGLTAAGLVIVVLLAFTWFFTDMPQAALSAIVIVAVWGLMDLPALRRYWEVRRADFVAATVGIAGVVLFGPLPGLGIAIVTSLLAIIYRSSAPRMEVLGRISDEKAAWGRLRGHTTRREVPGVVVVRLDSPLFWVNAMAIEDRVLAELDGRPDTRALVLDLEATSQLDTTSADMLDHLHGELAERGVRLYLARVIHPVSNVLERAGFLDRLGDEHIWHSISQCVRAARRDTGLKKKGKKADQVTITDAEPGPDEPDEGRPDSEEIVAVTDELVPVGGPDLDDDDEVEVVDDPTDDTTLDQYAGGGEPGQLRDRVVAFYLAALRDGHVRDACAAHVGDRLVQHGPRAREGVEGFAELCEAFVDRHPERYVRVARAIEDGRVVFLHVFRSPGDGEQESVSGEFFATDRAGRIVEHWDVVAPYETASWTGRTSIDGEEEVRDLERTDANRAVIQDALERLLTDRDERAVSDLVRPGCIEHGDGLDALTASITDPAEAWELELLVGEGNFVATRCRSADDGREHARVDLFRLEYGAVVEHWGLVEATSA